jgi:hypothetical protein
MFENRHPSGNMAILVQAGSRDLKNLEEVRKGQK